MTVRDTLRFVLTRLLRRQNRAADAERQAAAVPLRTDRRRKARTTLAVFFVAVIAIHFAVFLVLTNPRVRDPEYGIRTAELHDRIADHPRRPLVVVVGSSRVAMGVRPSEWEAVRPNDPSRPDPLIFNLSILGGGPITELITLRRMYADGFRPDVVLLEFWPPFLYSKGQWEEWHRIPGYRLMEMDKPVMHDYFPMPDRIFAEMRDRQRNPIFANREYLLMQLRPKWVPTLRRVDWMWDDVDDWGWKPGPDFPPGPRRDTAHANAKEMYDPLFADFHVSPNAIRALRASVALAQEHGSAVGFVFMPESSEFRSFYPERVEEIAREQLAMLTHELNIPVIHCRTWAKDEWVADGFHLRPDGAAEFTRRFGPAVMEAFPNLGVRP